ncbi:glycosyltransferase family 2 protein [Sinomonas susongensis]|uniref:glycosyltransferase family 2 protein n=1 Tax=Sinomonas susongensis TaxID=1324851 RepID=UPI001486A739|nr:glycosyltransferase family 2 protein [Sinomonas susongensis]
MSSESQPRVAIITRTKDRPRLLQRALRSILAQEFRDWALVVVNDGGDPNKVEEVLAEHADRLAGRVRVLHNQDSSGMEAASNQGIRASEGAYVAIHDDDDEWAPEFLAETVAYLDAHPEDGGVTVQTEIVFEQLTENGREVQERVPLEPNMQAITLVDLLHYNRFVPISFLFRREAYEALGGFDESLPVVGDWEFHLRFVVQHRVGFIKGRPLAFWNQRRDASGSEANSMIAGLADHHAFSLQVRDRLLREHAQANGLGPLLYERELLGFEMHRLHEHLDRVERELHDLKDMVRESTLPGTWRLRRGHRAVRSLAARLKAALPASDRGRNA